MEHDHGLNRVQYYRKRAQEARAEAEALGARKEKELLLTIAEAFDRLAEEGERPMAEGEDTD